MAGTTDLALYQGAFYRHFRALLVRMTLGLRTKLSLSQQYVPVREHIRVLCDEKIQIFPYGNSVITLGPPLDREGDFPKSPPP